MISYVEKSGLMENTDRLDRILKKAVKDNLDCVVYEGKKCPIVIYHGFVQTLIDDRFLYRILIN
ncbi:MAG TPA: hypothetical protein VIK72_11405 [Clostridiaceae bacterium]